MTKHVNKVQRTGQPCRCGCGGVVSQPAGSGRPRQWLPGHKPGETKQRLCQCGCGQQVVRAKGRGMLPKYLAGHSPTDKKYPGRKR